MEGKAVVNLLDLLVDVLEPFFFKRTGCKALHSRRNKPRHAKQKNSNVETAVEVIGEGSDQSIYFVPLAAPPSNDRPRLTCFRRLRSGDQDGHEEQESPHASRFSHAPC